MSLSPRSDTSSVEIHYPSIDETVNLLCIHEKNLLGRKLEYIDKRLTFLYPELLFDADVIELAVHYSRYTFHHTTQILIERISSQTISSDLLLNSPYWIGHHSLNKWLQVLNKIQQEFKIYLPKQTSQNFGDITKFLEQKYQVKSYSDGAIYVLPLNQENENVLIPLKKRKRSRDNIIDIPNQNHEQNIMEDHASILLSLSASHIERKSKLSKTSRIY